MSNKLLNEFLNIYENYFLRAYADLVAIKREKPIQILIEIENAFSHLLKALSSDENSNIYKENLIKGKNHLLRASLDAYKLLWVECAEELEKIEKNKDLRKFGLKLNELEFFALKNKCFAKAKEARKIEVENIGGDILKSIEAYISVLNEAKSILDQKDNLKIEHLKKFKLKTILKNHGIGFIVGILSGIIGTLIYNYIFSN